MDREEQYEVVISGVSGKFPSADDVEQLKEKLLEQRNLVSDENCRWNKEKWKVPSAVGKINVVKKFDDVFFGIHSGVAAMMDPLTRVSIERAYEALMDAGINPREMRESNTAVYTASCLSDAEAIGCDEKLTTKFWLLAHVRALLANRISYVLNLKGPSWTIDSTWIGGVACLNQAVDDIRKGRVENALVGVTNVINFPNISQHWQGLGKLSPDGSCHSFQETANGYGRSEGVVIIFLQRAEDAKRIYATVAHTDATFCGDEAHTLLKPKQDALVKFFQKFYATCEAPIEDVAFLEADGSADKYLDEIELNSIGEVLCNEKRDPLYVGAVKSNLGHAEGASSLVSIAKALISLDSDIIPPTVKKNNWNKNIKRLHSGEMKVITEPTPFPEGKMVAVNTLGLCTSVGHVLLKQNPKSKKVKKSGPLIPRLVLLSSRHEPGILNMVEKLESMPYDEEYFSMVNNVFKNSMTGHFYRGFTILGSTEKKIHFTLEAGSMLKRPLWFVFAGMGSQWPGMGADLMKLPIFAASIKELDTYLTPLGINIVDVISNYDPSVLKNTVHTFVGITAIQIALVDVLYAAGLKPDAMFGHSLGENACAYADGCFTKYQTIMAAYFRGKSSSLVPVKKGLMASIGVHYSQLTDLPPNVQIACHNSADNTTISGPFEDMQTYIKELKRRNIFVRIVNSNFIAYHSKQVQPLAPYVLENIRRIAPNPVKRSSRWISTSIPEEKWNSPLAETSSAEYHVNNFLSPVLFSEVVNRIPEDTVVIEISPHGLFQGILKRMVHESCFVTSTGKRETSNSLNFLLSSIGKLFVVGSNVDANAIYPMIEYPVSRGTPSLANLASWDHEKEWEIKVYDSEVKIKPLDVSLRDRKWRFLTDYKVNDKILIPFGILLMRTLEAFESNDPILIFENVNIPRHVEVIENRSTTVNIQVQYGSGNFEIVNEDGVVMNGLVRCAQDGILPVNQKIIDDDEYEDSIAFEGFEIADIFKQYSMQFSPELNNIKQIVCTSEGCQAAVTWTQNLAYFINTVAHVKLFYDLCFLNKGPTLPLSFLRLSVDAEKYNSTHSGTIVNFTYNKFTNIISGSGIELLGLKNIHYPNTSSENRFSFQNLQFISYDNPNTKNVCNFLSLCGQLVAETFSNNSTDEISKTFPLTVQITSRANDTFNFKTNVSSLFSALYEELSEWQIDVQYLDSEDLKMIPKRCSKQRRYFIICDCEELCKNELSQLANYVADIFLLTFGKTPEIANTLAKVTAEKFENFDLILCKKKVISYEKILKIDPYANANWVEDLQEELYSLNLAHSVVIQWYSEYIINVMDIIYRINTIERTHSTRFIVVMDKDQVGLTEDTKSVAEQLDKGLILNVYKNGAWGSIRNLEVNNVSQPDLETFFLRTKSIENVNLEFVALHRLHNVKESEEKIRYIEFSGTHKNQKKIMGIADTGVFYDNPEIVFAWPVPDKWSLEDAVTVPMAYVKVYYALIIKGKLRSGSSILVHSGNTIFGEAAITVALSMRCLVYTTVETCSQAKDISRIFSNTDQLTVLNSSSSPIDVEILRRTEGQGVDFIINACTGQQLRQSLTCLQKYGTILQLYEYDTAEKIGMEIFLKSTKMCSVTSLAVLKAQPDVKKEIENLITDALKNGVIQPFKRKVYDKIGEDFTSSATNITEKSYKAVIRQNSASSIQNNTFTCNPEKCYVIIGNKNEIWFSIVTWLLRHNVQKLVLIDSEMNENDDDQYQKRFLSFVQNYKNVFLMHLPSSTTVTSEECQSAMKAVSKFSQMDLVFCISLSDTQVQNLDVALRAHAVNLRQFICLQCDASLICESRRHASLPALNIIWDRSFSNPAILIDHIQNMLHGLLKTNSLLLYVCDTSQYVSKYKNSLQNPINYFLPSYSEAEYFVDSFSVNPIFEKVVSKCSYYCTRTQLFPIFMLPGLHSNRLKKLIRKLMYPVFCAKLPRTYSSASYVARSLVQSLRTIQPKGPYTVVGESWSGAIAIELAALLEETDTVQLILLEGIPKDMQNRLSTLGSFGSQNFVDILYDKCFYKEKVEEEDLLNNFVDNSKENKKSFLSLLQERLTMIQQYYPKGKCIRNKVIALKMQDPSIMNTFVDFEENYRQEVDLKILEMEDYEDFLDSDVTATLINDNVLFKW